MDVNEAIKTQEFFKKMRKEQVDYVVKTIAPTIAEYFEELKYQKDNEYKKMILEFIEELENSENVEKMLTVLKRYQQIVDNYKEKIEKVERKDKDIILVKGNAEKTKDLIRPVDLICGFIDNLIYGEYNKEQIQQYLAIWKEKSNINPLEAADIKVSPSGRHTNLAIAYKELNQEEQEK